MSRSPSFALAEAPHAELHLHIEGAIEPATMLRLAERNRVRLPYRAEDEIAASFQFTDLASFGVAYQMGVHLLVTEADFDDIAYSYMTRAASENVVHAEIAIAPHNHLVRGIAIEAVMDGLFSGLARAARDFGMSYAVILGLQRARGPDLADVLLDLVMPYRDRIAAIGLAGQELPYPPAPYAGVFRRARGLGWRAVAHAGEEGPPGYIVDALDLLKVDRIDHGVRAWEDPALIRRLVDEQVPLTVCPLSNIAIRNFARMEDHTIAAMLRAGVCVTINSDDPPFFGGYIDANYRAVVETFGLTADEQFQIARNGFVAAFMPDDLRARHLAELDRLHARNAA
jgi:adenosine deaminase